MTVMATSHCLYCVQDISKVDSNLVMEYFLKVHCQRYRPGYSLLCSFSDSNHEVIWDSSGYGLLLENWQLRNRVFILQYIHRSNHYIIHFNQCKVISNYISIKLEKTEFTQSVTELGWRIGSKAGELDFKKSHRYSNKMRATLCVCVCVKLNGTLYSTCLCVHGNVCFPNSVLSSSSFKTESELWRSLQVREKAGDVGWHGLKAL